MRTRPLLGLSALLLTATAACGQAGSSTAAGSSPPPTATGAGTGTAATGTGTAATGTGTGPAPGAAACEPVPGSEIVVLRDDRKFLTADNIVPAINAQAASPALVAALDEVSAALDTDKLIALNRKVDIERKTSDTVAREFVAAEKLTEGVGGGSGAVVVGAANFAENQTLAAVYEQVLDAAGFDASAKTIGNRQLYEPALERGEVDVVPEYLGTLTEFLNRKQNGPRAKALASPDVASTARALTALGRKAGLVFGKPSEAADQNAFAVTKGFADRHGLATLSDLAGKCDAGRLTLGGPPECPTNVFCQAGLERAYALKLGGFRALDAGGPLTKTALKKGEVHLGLVFTSDGSLAG